MDTIVALATARGRAGVAIVRVSGTLAWQVCQALAGSVPEPRHAKLLVLRDSSDDILDQALVLVFEEGRSFTGEKVCEFQIHGSVAVVVSVLQACLAISGVRTADPGEFTRRAFINGNLDLTEVEALADLIDSETEGQRRQAMRVLDGTAGRIVEAWREDLLLSLTMIEASMDFADEELPDDLMSYVDAPMDRVLSGLMEQLQGRRASETIRDGYEVAIIGRVNTGKSTLLNVLAGRDAAITSERAGTTRDVIEVRMDIAGMAVTLIDTAGLRKTSDEIERVGIERGMSRARDADLRVFLKSSPDDWAEGVQAGDIVLLSKADVWEKEGISALTGEGVSELIAEIQLRLSHRVKFSSVFARERHFDKLQSAADFLTEGRIVLNGASSAWELVSEEIHGALRCLDGIVGRVDVEDVLGRIFSSFCIGK